MRWVSLLTTAVLCSACSSLPSKQDLAAFGDASSKGVAVVTQVVASGETLRTRQDELRQVSKYMRGARFAAESIPILPDPSQAVIDAQLKIRLSALSDLQAYAKAVGDAADQGAIDGLIAATEKLGSNIGELAKLAAPEIAPVAAPAFKALGKAVGYGLADGYVRKVNAVIKEADLIVAEVIRLLRQDLAELPPDIDIEAGTYAALRDEQLHIIRSDSRVTRSDLYGAYFSARTDIAANYELAKAATAIDGVLKSIADTHHALAQGKPDVDLTIKRMSALSTDLAAVIAALRKG
ncbi:hypothetical protein [Agrobacterium cavarae]|uniref:hypothetical protein n=1 Tax=Agrobacterium cavarae TaxID=2528239 RepID=UPI0028ADC4D2|nr:hypothetical protein [Agrobacterium cavarae]